jgi:hypothetical protein
VAVIRPSRDLSRYDKNAPPGPRRFRVAVAVMTGQALRQPRREHGPDGRFIATPATDRTRLLFVSGEPKEKSAPPAIPGLTRLRVGDAEVRRAVDGEAVVAHKRKNGCIETWVPNPG